MAGIISLILYSVAIPFLFLYAGYGLSSLLLPRKLAKDILWIAPWVGIAFIGVGSSILSFAKISMDIGAVIIMVCSFIALIYAGITKKISFPRWYETVILSLGCLITYVLVIAPLAIQAGFPTVVSLGNLDPISYTHTADFLINHTVWQGAHIEPFSPKYWAIGDLVHYSYRWGSPMLLSFVNALLSTSSYQIYSLVISWLFALAFPLLAVLLKHIINNKNNTITAWVFLFITYSLNATYLYMLFHVFFAQFVFTGICAVILLLVLSYDRNTSYFNIRSLDILLALVFSSVTTLYPEGLIFIGAPFGLAAVLWYIVKKNVFYGVLLMKITALAFLINPITFRTAIDQNIKIIFSTSQNTFIGWEYIRHAFPIELMGFYNLYHYRALPFIIAALSSLPIMGMWFIGLRHSKNALFTGSVLLAFVSVLIYFITLNDNFFLFHRTVLYCLFLLNIFFAIGMARFTSMFESFTIRLIIIGVFLLIGVRSFQRTWMQMYYHMQVVDEKLISLKELDAQNIQKPIYTSDVLLGEYHLWDRLWQEYMLSNTPLISRQNYITEKTEGRLPAHEIVLASKDMLERNGVTLSYKTIIWENEYYILGEINKPIMYQAQ